MAWLAEFEIRRSGVPLRLLRLDPIGRLAGDDRRDAFCGYLVDRILSSQQTAWGMDFPCQITIAIVLKVASTVDRWLSLQQVAMLVIPLTA